MRKEMRQFYTPETIEKINTYTKEYVKAHYDRFLLQMPKGKKEFYKKYADEQNLSLTKFFLMTADDWIERNE